MNDGFLKFCCVLPVFVHLLIITHEVREIRYSLKKLEAELITPQEVTPQEEKTTNDKIVDLLEDIRDLCYIRSNP